MSESEFLELSEATLAAIERSVDDAEIDVEATRSFAVRECRGSAESRDGIARRQSRVAICAQQQQKLGRIDRRDRPLQEVAEGVGEIRIV